MAAEIKCGKCGGSDMEVGTRGAFSGYECLECGWFRKISDKVPASRLPRVKPVAVEVVAPVAIEDEPSILDTDELATIVVLEPATKVDADTVNFTGKPVVSMAAARAAREARKSMKVEKTISPDPKPASTRRTRQAASVTADVTPIKAGRAKAVKADKVVAPKADKVEKSSPLGTATPDGTAIRANARVITLKGFDDVTGDIAAYGRNRETGLAFGIVYEPKGGRSDAWTAALEDAWARVRNACEAVVLNPADRTAVVTKFNIGKA